MRWAGVVWMLVLLGVVLCARGQGATAPATTRTGDAAGPQEAAIKAQVRELHELLGTQDDRTPRLDWGEADLPPSRATAGGMGFWPRQLIAGAVFAGTAVVLAALWHWRARVLAAGMIAVMLVGGLSGQAATEKATASSGAGACALLLEYAAKDGSLAEIAAELGDQARLPAMRACLAKRGMTVEAAEGISLEQVLARLPGARTAVLALDEGGRRRFVAAFWRDPVSVVMVDPGVRLATVPPERLRQWYQATFTGRCLWVNAAPPEGPRALDRTPMTIWAGTPAAGARGELEVAVAVRNPYAVPLSLEGSDGSCSCLLEAALVGARRGTLGPGETGTLRLWFDAKEFGTGAVKRPVMLQLQRERMRNVRLYVRAYMPAGARP